MANIDGLVAVNDLESNRAVLQMEDEIRGYDFEPDQTPLFVMLPKLGKSVVENPTFNHLEDDLLGKWTAINNGAGYNSGATSIVVDDGTIFKVGSLMKIARTGEVVRITAISTHTLTVSRSWGGTAAAAMVDNDWVLNLGVAYAEGATYAASKLTQATQKTSYTQIFKNSVELTGTQAETKVYGGNYRQYQRKKIGIEHKRDIEMALFFSEKNEDTSGSEPIRSMSGILESITTNTRNINGTLTLPTFLSLLGDSFRYGSKEKVLICGKNVSNNLDLWLHGKVQVSPNATKLGVKLQRFESSHGALDIVKHPLFENDYAGYGFILDMSQLEYVYMKNRDTKLSLDIHDKKDDKHIDQWMTECGLRLGLEKTHAYFYGVSV